MKNLLMIAMIMVSFNISFARTSKFINKDECSISTKDSLVTSTFTISNLGCGTDAAAMQKTIAQTKGIKTCVVNHQKGTAVIKYDASKISKEEIVKIIENCSLCHDKTAKPFKVKEIK